VPSAPLRECSWSGCRTLVTRGRCDAHEAIVVAREAERRAAFDRARPNATARGYGTKWRNYSKRRLRSHPLCVMCAAKGITRLAEVTDHIVPHRGDKKLFWDPKNHQSLCRPCNTTKEGAPAGRVRRYDR
jgi:5-methylcytosine-specific restriction enzyme A